jgi:UDP-N-acetylmuramate--alanine ligase
LRILYYGFNQDNDLRIEGARGTYSVFRDGAKLGEFQLQLPGRHNALNATAALASGLEAGFPFAVCAEGLQQFAGVDRRFQHKGAIGGIEVYDDYGHHPTEVQAVLLAFKEKFPDRRIVTVFQPHRYSRTLLCWDQFLTCFNEADHLFICDIYAAGEDPLANISSERLTNELKTAKGSAKIEYLASATDRLARLKAELKSGDVLVTLGAGDVYKLGMQVLGGAV